MNKYRVILLILSLQSVPSLAQKMSLKLANPNKDRQISDLGQQLDDSSQGKKQSGESNLKLSVSKSQIVKENLSAKSNVKLALNELGRTKDDANDNLASDLVLSPNMKKLAVNEKVSAAMDSGSEEVLIQSKKATKDPSNDQLTKDNRSAPVQDVTSGVVIKEIVEPSADYHFSTFGKDDPFKPSIKDIAEESKVTVPGSPLLSILQKYELKELKLVGVWRASDGLPKAMVTAPSGSGIIVEKGDLIGAKGGRILEILDDHLVVREFFVTFDGTRQFEDNKMLIESKKDSEIATSDLSYENAVVGSPASNTALQSGQQSPSTTTMGLDAQNKSVQTSTSSQGAPLPTRKLLYDYSVVPDPKGETNPGENPVIIKSNPR